MAASVRPFLTLLMVLAMLGTLGVLAAGVFGLVKGSRDPRRANQLMRWRIILQAVAIALFVLLLTLFRR